MGKSLVSPGRGIFTFLTGGCSVWPGSYRPVSPGTILTKEVTHVSADFGDFRKPH